MAVSVPTTQELKDQNVSNFESKLNQTSPLLDKAFIRVISTVEATIGTSLLKFATERILQNLALTATEEDLDNLGIEYKVLRKQAVPAILDIQLPGTNGTLIPTTATHTGDSNGETYLAEADVLISGGFANIRVTAQTPGVAGNLNINDTLTIDTQIAGAESVSTVVAIVDTGADEETDDAYRVRVLDVIRAQGGGGNTADYRINAQQTPGVTRAYPYASRPIDAPSAPPPNRTVFIEADTSIDPDGLAPSSLLDDAREFITTDPDTGIARQPLGLTDSTLFVKSITRTSIFIEIRNLDVLPDQEAKVKSDIDTALTAHFLSLNPFVDGLDPIFERNDLITDLSISNIIQDILEAAGASATGAGFGLSVGAFLPSFRLQPGEKVKLGTITFI